MKSSQGDRKENQNKVVARRVWGRNGTDNKKGLGERAQSADGKIQRNMYVFGLVFGIDPGWSCDGNLPDSASHGLGL